MPACSGKRTASRRTGRCSDRQLVPARSSRRTWATFTIGITKTTADGTTFGIRNNTNYRRTTFRRSSLATSNPSQLFASDWQTNFEATFSHPLLQGGGAQYNRIAGPLSFDQYAAGFGNPIDGVMIARIRTDQTLADFEGGVRNLMRDVEDAYWELYFTYRDLEARKMGRDSALETWKKTAALYRTGSQGRQRRPRSPGSLAILPVPRPGGTGAHRSVPRPRTACGTSWACRCRTAG